VLSKGGNNEILAAWGEGNDPHASIFGALDPADQALRDEAIDSDTDRAWGQIDHWAYRIDGQRPFAQQEFQYVVRPLIASGHKNLNLPEVYSINSIDINIRDANAMAPIQKENRVMRTASVVARYLAGVIFLVMGLNGFLNFIPFPPPAGVAGQFMAALYVSHYLWVIFAFQVIAGALLLVNRYVPLALAVLAPVIVNILTFHALMAPSGLPLALFVAVLWAVIFIDVRPAFSGLFQSRLEPRA
jgi:putative oxidoreductase